MSQKIFNSVQSLRSDMAEVRIRLAEFEDALRKLTEDVETNYARKRGPKVTGSQDGQEIAGTSAAQ